MDLLMSDISHVKLSLENSFCSSALNMLSAFNVLYKDTLD